MMVRAYYNRLLLGTITYEAIPTRYQKQVKELAIADVESGKMSYISYEQMFHEEYPRKSSEE